MAIGCTTSPAAQQGGVGQHCYPNGSCNTALSCFSNLCVDTNPDGAAGQTGGGGSGGAAGAGAAGGRGGDAGGAAGAAGHTGVAGAGGGAADAATFSVLSLPGLSLWLEASQGVSAADGGAGVSRWSDQSGKGNDAVATSTEPNQVPGSINGLPAIEFGASAAPLGIQMANGTANLAFGTGPFLIEVVVKSGARMPAVFETASGLSSLEVGGDTVGHATVTETSNGTLTVASTNAPFGNGVPYLVGVQRTGAGGSAILELRLDGFVDGMTPDGAPSLGDLASGRVGGGAGATEAGASSVDVAEVVVVKGASASGNLASLEGYLKAKYGL